MEPANRVRLMNGALFSLVAPPACDARSSTGVRAATT
jgi:hypothetical protein